MLPLKQLLPYLVSFICGASIVIGIGLWWPVMLDSSDARTHIGSFTGASPLSDLAPWMDYPVIMTFGFFLIGVAVRGLVGGICNGRNGPSSQGD